MQLLFHLLSGAVGGNLLGTLTRGKPLLNTVFGLLGGGIGHFGADLILELAGGYSDFGAFGTYGVSVGLGAVAAVAGRIFLGGKKKAD